MQKGLGACEGSVNPFFAEGWAHHGGYGKTWNATGRNATCGDDVFCAM